MKNWFVHEQEQEGITAPTYEGKIRFLTVAAIVGAVISTAYSIWDLSNGNIVRAMVELIFPATVPLVVYRLRHDPGSYTTVMNLLAVLVFLSEAWAAFFLYDIRYMVWYPTYPLIYFYVLGHRGLSWATLLFVFTWLMYLGFPYFSDFPRISFYAMSNTMIAYVLITLLSWMYSREILFYQRTITKRAHYDYLTGVYNRIAWLERLNQEIAVQQRNASAPLSVIMFDVDDFKQVNDAYGHHVGDKVLIDACDMVARRLRKSDVLGRWGGEEFIILLPNTNQSQAVAVAEELRDTLANQQGVRMHITASFGVLEYHPDDDVAGMLQRVDDLLYQAKAAGKNRVVAA